MVSNCPDVKIQFLFFCYPMFETYLACCELVQDVPDIYGTRWILFFGVSMQHNFFFLTWKILFTKLNCNIRVFGSFIYLFLRHHLNLFTLLNGGNLKLLVCGKCNNLSMDIIIHSNKF